MPNQVFPLPSFTGNSLDLLFCNPQAANSPGTLHYAYTVGAEQKDAVVKRTFQWTKIQDFSSEYTK